MARQLWSSFHEFPDLDWYLISRGLFLFLHSIPDNVKPESADTVITFRLPINTYLACPPKFPRLSRPVFIHLLITWNSKLLRFRSFCLIWCIVIYCIIIISLRCIIQVGSCNLDNKRNYIWLQPLLHHRQHVLWFQGWIGFAILSVPLYLGQGHPLSDVYHLLTQCWFLWRVVCSIGNFFRRVDKPRFKSGFFHPGKRNRSEETRKNY